MKSYLQNLVNFRKELFVKVLFAKCAQTFFKINRYVCGYYKRLSQCLNENAPFTGVIAATDVLRNQNLRQITCVYCVAIAYYVAKSVMPMYKRYIGTWKRNKTCAVGVIPTIVVENNTSY